MSDRDSIRRVLGKWDKAYGERILAVLEPNEELIAAGPGAFEGRLLGEDASVPGALFVTNQRIIKLTENVIGIKETDSLPLEQISAVDETTLLLGLVQVKITAPDTSLKGTGRGLQGLAVKINAARRKKKEPEKSTGVDAGDPLEQIEKLGELRSNGLIDQAEFDQLKAALLGNLNSRNNAQSGPRGRQSTKNPAPQQADSTQTPPVAASPQKPRSNTKPTSATKPIFGERWFETPKGWFLHSPLMFRLGVLVLITLVAGYVGALEGRDFWAVFLILFGVVAGFWSFAAAVVKNQSFLSDTKRVSRWARLPVWLASVLILVPVSSVMGAGFAPEASTTEASTTTAKDAETVVEEPQQTVSEEAWPELQARYLAQIEESAPSNFANDEAALNYLGDYCRADLFGDAGETDVVDRIAAKYCQTALSAHLGVEEPSVETLRIDEEEFIKVAGEKYGVFPETYEDGSSNTPVSMARFLCENADVSELERNLGDRFDESFQKFAMESFCPQKLG